MAVAASKLAADLIINSVSDVLGAEVVGLDVSQPFDGETMARVRQAFKDHHLLCFRDQHLEDDALVAFSKQFGPLEAFPEKDKTKGKVEVYHVANVSTDGDHLPDDDPRVVFQRNNGR
jgi:alpha-ketoglutarate-dependent taurine dioxygenase